MPRVLVISTSLLAVLLASVYQFWLRDALIVALGVGRRMENIERFPYSCRRFTHEKLQACEDMWLDDKARVLYAACANVEYRLAWVPCMDKLNASGRPFGATELIALDIDSPGEDTLFKMRSIKTEGYAGPAGDASLDYIGLDAETLASGDTRFYFTNQRPPVDENNKIIEAHKVGANDTVEIFDLRQGSSRMKHIRTILSSEVWSPNRVAALGGGAFVTTNDHSGKVGLRKKLDYLIGGGNVAYCSSSGHCHVATTDTLKFPNGLARGKDGLIYVPSSVDGNVYVFQLQSNKTLTKIDTIPLGMPLDNISPDANGDIWVAGIPKLLKLTEAFAHPYTHDAPVTIFRIRKTGSDYEVNKVLEDGEGKIVSGVTTVRHDVKTGRLFMSSVSLPFLMVCDPK